MHAASPSTDANRPWSFSVRLWRLLLHPWLSLVMLVLALVLGAAVTLLPQLPAQLLNEPAGASRWSATVASQQGIWGNLILGLGLFSVLHSPITWLFLIMVASAVAAQLTESIATMRQVSWWRTHTSGPALPPGSPVDLGRGPGRVRRRLGVAMSADNLVAAVADYAFAHFDSVTRGVVESSLADQDPAPDESRLFCLRNPGALRLRVLLPAGLLIAVGGVMLGLRLGWQSTPPLLAPGAVYRDGSNELQIAYPPPAGPDQPVTLVVRLGATESVIHPSPGRGYAIGPATLRVNDYHPGLWLTTRDASAQLAHPGRNDTTSAVGIACSAPGDEDSLLIPSVGAGLRILCGDDTPEFRVELYQIDSVQPIFAADVFPGDRIVVPLADTLGLDLAAVPALAVSVSSFPQLWLAWLGIIIAVIGAVGYVRPTGFILIQVIGLGATYSALIVQSDSISTAETLLEQVTVAEPLPGATSAD